MECFTENSTSGNFGFNWWFIKRTYRIFKLVHSTWISLPSILFYFLLVLALVEQYLIYNVGMISSKYYTVLGTRDYAGFWSTTINSLLSICALVLVMSVKRYICNILYITWRKLLCAAIHQYYFFNIRYYRMNVIDAIIDNPDQRVTQDVDKMCNVWSKIIDIIIIAPFRIIYYTYASAVSTGYLGPTAVFVFFVVGTVANKLFMTPVVRSVFKQEKLEGNFRFKHMQVRSNAEPLAFLNGGPTESDETNRKLDALIRVQMKLYNRQFPLTISINLFDYVGSILSYLIIAGPIFGGKYDSYDGVQLSSLISQTSFVVMYLVNSFSQLVDQADKVVDIAGCTHRVGQLIETLVNVYRPLTTLERARYDSRYSEEPDSDENTYCVIENLSFGPPNSSVTLVQGLNLTIKKRVNVLITGDSGIGKSSLLRVLCGIWPLGKGFVRHYYQNMPIKILFLPQNSYLTGGSLFRQIIFPLEESGEESVDVTAIIEYLKFVNLEKLLERTGGLFEDPEWNWCDALSPGELQRLSFVRLFYHRPQIAFLDEATSALNIEMETKLHQQCDFLGITLVSVGHRRSLRRFHQLNLHLSGSRDEGRWSLTTINQENTGSL